MSTPQTEILKEFIADEASTCPFDERGSYYPDNHHRITPLVARASKLLTEQERIELYFHLLRLDGCPTIKSAGEFNLLLEAYSRLKTLFIRGYPSCSLKRPKGLFLFGTDDHGPLIGEPPTTHEAYLAHLKFWRYADSFSHMPGMLKRQQQFLELSSDEALVDRVARVLVRVEPVDDIDTPTCIWFWSLVLLVIQQKHAGQTAVEWLIRVDCPAAYRQFFLQNLVRYLRASDRHDLLTRFERNLPSPHEA